MHLLLVALFLLSSTIFSPTLRAAAQDKSGATGGSAAAEPNAVAGKVDPAPSDQPNVLVRDANYKSTIRAIKLTAPLKFDGRLDDEVYTRYPGCEGMLQAAPQY